MNNLNIIVAGFTTSLITMHPISTPVDYGIPMTETEWFTSVCSRREGSVITLLLHCDKRLIPNVTVTSICTSDGKWYSDSNTGIQWTNKSCLNGI